LIVRITSPQESRFECRAAGQALLVRFVYLLLTLTRYAHHAAIALAGDLFQVVAVLIGEEIGMPTMGYRVDRGRRQMDQPALHGIAFVVSSVGHVIALRITERFTLCLAIGWCCFASGLVQQAIAFTVFAADAIAPSAGILAKGIAVLAGLAGALYLP
jgi:hypothetical protein